MNLPGWTNTRWNMQRASCRALALLIAVPVLLGMWIPDSPDFEGRWQLVEERSSPVDPWSRLALEMHVDGSEVTVERMWSVTDHTRVDSMTVETGGVVNDVPFRRWLDNRHLSVQVGPDSTQQVTARWLDDGRTLQVASRFELRASQGIIPVRTYTEYRLSPNGRTLIVLELRSTRPRAIRYVFTRADLENSY